MPSGQTVFDFLATPTAQAVIWMFALAVVLVLGYYIVQKFRDGTGEDRLTANELMTNFREMNREGDITDEEFRTIKTVLREPLKSEVKDSSDEG
jgi:uncharacterized membrane protein